LFSNTREKGDLRIAIENKNIERVESTKFLGIYIDSKLNWKEHIAHVKRKVAISLSVLHKVKYIVNTPALYSLYCTIILPHLMYCCEIWGNNYQETIKPLHILQKRAMRILDGAKNLYREHTSPIFFKFNLLNIYDIIKYQSMSFMYKVNCQLLPDNLQCFFKLNNAVHKYNTKQSSHFAIKFCRTTHRSFSLSIQGPRYWNSLPIELKICKSLQNFKTSFKKSLVSKYIEE